MNLSNLRTAVGILAVAAWLSSGCSREAPPQGKPAGQPSSPAEDGDGDHDDHATGEAAHADDEHPDEEAAEHAGDGHDEDEGHHEAPHEDGEHHGQALSEDDVAMPSSFTDGVARLEELHANIEQLIEGEQLADVHRVAEEMALVAKHMKSLARTDVAEDEQTEAGRLCNQVAGFFGPIDEAADGGDEKGTREIHKQMQEAVVKLRTIAGDE